MLLNRWEEKVSNTVLSKFESWVEKYLVSTSCGCNMFPMWSTRYIYHKFYDANDHARFKVEVKEGPELQCFQTGIRDFQRMTDFTAAFRSTTDLQQALMLSYLDPFDSLKDPEVMKEFLHACKVSRKEYISKTGKAFIALQRNLSSRGLIRGIMTDEIRTWEKIAQRIHKSVPTAMKFAVADVNPLRVFMDGGTVYTREELICEWESEREKHLLYKLNNKRRMRSENS